MLTTEEGDFVTGLLSAVLWQITDVRLPLVSAMGPRLAERFDNGPRMVLISNAIRLCIDDAYNSHPPALARLLEIIRDRDPRIPLLIARINNPPQPVGGQNYDPFLANILFTKLPFLERSSTRTALRALLQLAPRQPFVVINGLSKSGKSYTAQFISHVLLERRQPMSCLISVPAGGGVGVGPSALARDLVARMGGDLSTQPPKDTNLERWYEELVSWITAPGIKDDVVWWIVLDGFNRAELRDDTRVLIAKLAARLTNAKPQRLFRLILLDFDHTALPVTPGLISVEVTQPIPKASVEVFLTGVFGGAKDVSVPNLLAEVTAGLSDPIVELPVLAERLGSMLQAAAA